MRGSPIGIGVPGTLMAVNAVMTIPVILLFLLAQRTFIPGITLTGLRG